MLDDSVIYKLCEKHNQLDKYHECLEAKKKGIEASISRKNPPDDLKSARNHICTDIKKILGLSQCGNSGDTFLRDTLAPLIQPDMDIYNELEAEIFGD